MEQLYRSQSQSVREAAVCVFESGQIPLHGPDRSTYSRDLSQPSKAKKLFGHPVVVQEGRDAALGIEEACS